MPNDVTIQQRYEIETRDIEYLRHGERCRRGCYRPKGEGPFPALVEVHGGAWASGDRLNNAPLDEALAKSGIAVLAIDFRMPPGAPLPGLDRRHPLRDPLAQGACRRVRQPARPGRRRSARRAAAHQLLLERLKPNDPRYAALPLAEAPGEDATTAVYRAVLADLGPAGALPHGQGEGQHPARRGARRLLGLGGRDGGGQPAAASSSAARRRRRCRRRSSCRAPPTTT